ncbi:right-handed parallel beta-helix repeat-containing protein [Neobacillus ginsengisoli]|uniref:Right-handed parallel beta-helix repeat-containing protein n=1 Tax=Neobacillus ginsengisoli TaxID=904295 RepID=A0ABT9XT82_9BACI|nr:NosD domain-containing protein [Neobacillus ginsengisoli]MDQ0198769.1 hypothetical protein [Neobacillus ginsengisoli]
MIYEIELIRWGITKGIPSKPYTSQNYITANNNITGINNALSWAKDNNYNYVSLPKGEYSICYPKPILTQPNMTIDFNFSTLKVIYDSDTRSPLDTSTNPIYLFGGTSILCTTSNTHIINLKLIGDRVDRSWRNLSSERMVDITTGIKFGSGSDRSSVRNCNLSYYMGDAIYLSYSPYSSFDIGTMEFGDMNTIGSPVISPSSKTLRSTNFIPLPYDITSFTMIGLGYAPTTTIPSGMYNVYFYKSDNTFIVRKTNVRTRDLVNIPKYATKIKLTWEGNGTVDDGCLPGNPPYWALLLKNGISDNVIIEYNEIHRCHRGALFLGTNNVLIRKNYFHDTGVDSDTDLDGLPTFSDFTRYAINTEDNVGQNCKIIDNVFDNVRMAIALRGEFNEVSSNEFRNCTYGVFLYYLKHCLMDKNYFHYSSMGCFEYNNFDRNWIITNNIFSGKGISFGGSGSISAINNNYFYNSYFLSPIRILSFKNNSFNNSYFQFIDTLTCIDGCSFINNSTIKIISILGVIDKIIRCNFVNSSILAQNSQQVIVRESLLKESGFIYSTGKITYTLSNCKVENTNRPVINSYTPLDIGLVSHILEIKDCTISLGKNAIISSMDWGKLIIHQSTISYNITSNFTTALLDIYGNIKDALEIKNSTISSSPASASHSINGIKNIILVDNIFSNFSLLNASTTIETFDSTMPYIRIPDTGNTSPTSIPMYIGQMYIDTTSKKIYQAVGTSSSGDWVALN